MTFSKCQMGIKGEIIMKHSKRRLAIMLIGVCTMLFTGCGTSYSSDDDVKEIVNNVANEIDKFADGIKDGAESAETGGKLASINEIVLLEQDEIKITAKEYINDAIWGDGIKILIENSGTRNLGVGCNAVIVNNYMISDLFSSTIAAGKKANETIYLSSSELKAAGIEKVGQIELSFHVYDSDSYENVFDTDLLSIQTSYYNEMDIVPEDAGTELLNQTGVRIVGKVVDENSFWGTAVLLYLENKSGKNVIVSCDNMSVNGFMVTPYLYSSVYDGKMAIDEITIMSSDLEENGISSIENIELSFHIIDSESFQTVFDSEPITFSAK